MRALALERRHCAVADRRGGAIEWFGKPNARAAVRRAPGEESLFVLPAPNAERTADRIMQGCARYEIIGAEP